jgi:diguanylate cyclase (GGDEF)-like protein
VERVARDVINALTAPFVLGQASASVSASIGIAICPDDGEDPETLTQAADRAMYAAKISGRNGFSFCVNLRPGAGNGQ